RQTAMEAATVRDLPDFRDHPVDRLQRSRRDPSTDENGGDDADEKRDEEREQELFEPKLCRLRVRAGKDCSELIPGVGNCAHDVVERRSGGLDTNLSRQLRTRCRGRKGDQVQLVELRTGQAARVRGWKQAP